MRNKVISLILLFSMSALLLCGCEKKQIFVDKDAKYRLKQLKDTELLNDNYYVKDKSEFYVCYMPEGRLGSGVTEPNSSRVAYLEKDTNLIPTLYKDELIAYPSAKMNLDKVTLERLSYVGYSFGMYGGVIDDDGYLYYSVKKNCIDGTSARKEFEKSDSDDIRIISVDGEKITDSSYDNSGIILNLKAGQKYEVEYYAGTKYMKSMITADRSFLESFEVFTLDEIATTKNGYLSIQLPEDYKSGYYCINGFGCFKYYDFKKGEKKVNDIDMNEPYYTTEEEKLTAYSQQYVVNISEKTRNVKFNVSYDIGGDNALDEKLVRGILTSPDGKVYDLEQKDSALSVEIKEAIAGKWVLNILPKSLKIVDVTADSTTPNEDATPAVFTFDIAEEQKNIQFKATYSGEWANAKDNNDVGIWGTVENENHEAVDMNVDNKTKELTAVYPYLAPGKYTVTIYYYYGITVEDVNYGEDDNQYEDIIITEEELDTE